MAWWTSSAGYSNVSSRESSSTVTRSSATYFPSTAIRALTRPPSRRTEPIVCRGISTMRQTPALCGIAPAAYHDGGCLQTLSCCAQDGPYGAVPMAKDHLVSRRDNAHRTRGARNRIQHDIGGACSQKPAIPVHLLCPALR